MRKPPHVPPRGARSLAGLLQEGLELHQAGRLEEGARRYREVLASDPANADANHLLGLVHLQQGDHARAIEHIARAVASRPDPQYLCNLGVALNGAGRHEEAVVALRRATEANPGFAEAFSNLGMALRALRRTDEAVRAFQRAAELKPQEAGFRYNLGNALSDAGHIVEAEAAYREALRLRPNHPAAVRVLTSILLDHGKAREGLELVDAALAAHPADPRLHMQRGRLLASLGQLQDAVTAFDRSIALRPGFGEAHLNRALIRRHVSRDADLAAMESLFADKDAALDDRIFAGFALARALADIGSHDASVETCLAVNRMHRQRISFSLERAETELHASLERYSGITALPPAAADGPGPIFVVGLPRAGKSTIEAILSRHSRIAAAGELPTLGRLAAGLARELGQGDASPERLGELARAYDEEARHFTGPGRIIVDTMPANYRHIGLIREAFPRARVIWCRRDPASHCIAIFEKYLTSDGYEYASDLGELIPFHAAYSRLASAWIARAPELILEIDVARLRSDPEAHIRRLAAFCGLEWEEGLLSPVETLPRLGLPPAGEVSREEAEHLAAWYRAVPALAAAGE